jgi:hypothetical protein
MRLRDDVRMWVDVRMCGCADVRMCGCADVQMCEFMEKKGFWRTWFWTDVNLKISAGVDM